MKKLFFNSILCILMLAVSHNATAQQFHTKGIIDYEMVQNNHSSLGEGWWSEMYKNRIPRLSKKYFSLKFSAEASSYTYTGMDEKTKLPWYDDNDDEDNVWYANFEQQRYINQKNVYGDLYVLNDTFQQINWRITNEFRDIAGYNCRKAIGRIYDSVYVFAFYTDEIMVSGGPLSLHGLPGMILGVTIPRLSTSWMATKVTILNTAPPIAPPTKGKKGTKAQILPKLVEATKDWGKYGRQRIWEIFL